MKNNQEFHETPKMTKYNYYRVQKLFAQEKCELLTSEEEYKNLGSVVRWVCPRGCVLQDTVRAFRRRKKCKQCKARRPSKAKPKVRKSKKFKIVRESKKKGFDNRSNWKLSVYNHAEAASNTYGIIYRPDLIQNHLSDIIQETKTTGQTPDRSMDFYMQQLRKMGLIYFVIPGIYRLRKKIVYNIKKILAQKHRSKGEMLMAMVLEERGIEYTTEKTFTDLKDKRSLRCDVYFKYNGKEYVWEYQGQQHYKAIEFFGGEESFRLLQKHDKMKVDYASKKGIELFVFNKIDPEGMERCLNQILSD